MGDPVRILDLAEDLIRLSGLEPYRDIDITYTGTRPGEKLTEELWDADAPLRNTSHPDIFRLEGDTSLPDLAQALDSLTRLSLADDTDGIVALLNERVPGASLRGTPQLDIISII